MPFQQRAQHEEVLESFLDDLNATFDDDEDEFTKSDEDREKGRVAEATFGALFGKVEGFDIKKLFIQEKVTKESAMHDLCGWASCFKWPEGMVNGLWKQEVEDEETLQKILTGFCESGLWPLIDNLTIYLDAPLLKNGVVLVDLPGYHDANFAREKIARQTQQKCDDIFVVANISRAVDSPILQKAVRENTVRPNAGLLTLQTVTAVCTHSADQGRDVEKLANPHTLRAAKARLAELKKDEACYKDIARAKQNIMKIVMAARNRKIDRDMQERYSSKLGEDRFKVFCVDSALFMDPEDEEMEDDAEDDMSGVRRLQQHVDWLPAKSLFQVNDALIGLRYQAMVCSFANWVAGCRAETDASGPVLPQPDALREFDQNLRKWAESVLVKFIASVVRHLRLSQNEVSDGALAVASAWRSIHHSTVLALCRKEGCHTSGRYGECDWSRELITAFDAVIKPRWVDFSTYLRTSLATLNRMLSDAFQQYPQICKDLGAPDRFLQALMSRQTMLDDAAGTARDAFLKQLGLLRRNFAVSQENCYVTAAMRRAYRKCVEDKGISPAPDHFSWLLLTGYRQRCS